MALIFPSSSTFIFSNNKPYFHLHQNHHHLPNLTAIKAQNDSSSSSSSTEPTQSTDNSSSPVGFGSSSSNSEPVKKKPKGKKERASIIRRAPVETPKFASQPPRGGDESTQQGVNERAFLLTWLGLGSLIIFEGLALAASGFLPQEWDGFFVKYLYPSFTPTVFLFVAGTVVYGVSKYLENENPNNSS
ncbi:hypothetical protein OSB04_026230 [Centaurea solstitialis]|uniref:Protein LOW PSII ACCUMULATION 2, chloroplastic n=1 Tax=Centaurea solstitialis TaxID=347529 RepID=A0AA38SCR2_9ASTR|nr:hypothetical protein OSB04_026230 [Centaurea solstitialis]